MLFIGQKLTHVWRIKSFLRIYIFPKNLSSCGQKAWKNIQTKFHWDRMKNKHFIEVSNICPAITLKHNGTPFSDMPINSYRFKMIEQHTTWPESVKNSVAMATSYSTGLVLTGIFEVEFIGMIDYICWSTCKVMIYLMYSCSSSACETLRLFNSQIVEQWVQRRLLHLVTL